MHFKDHWVRTWTFGFGCILPGFPEFLNFDRKFWNFDRFSLVLFWKLSRFTLLFSYLDQSMAFGYWSAVFLVCSSYVALSDFWVQVLFCWNWNWVGGLKFYSLLVNKSHSFIYATLQLLMIIDVRIFLFDLEAGLIDFWTELSFLWFSAWNFRRSVGSFQTLESYNLSFGSADHPPSFDR